MKEVFQRDIDSTIAEILAYEPPSDDEGISKALQSEFEGKCYQFFGEIVSYGYAESELCGHEVEESSAQNRKKVGPKLVCVCGGGGGGGSRMCVCCCCFLHTVM